MNFRKLGSSGIEVSEISLGSWLTYSGGVAREQSEACVKAAFDAGINFIDTANVYGKGASETLLGEVLAGYERSEYVLATKVYFEMSPTDRGLSAAQIHKQIDASLKRLKTDYVDLYQCHRYDEDTPLEETMAALTEVVQGRQGAADRLQRMAGGARSKPRSRLPDVERWVSSQPQYSILWRGPEAEVIPLCEREDISQIVWSPLAQGVLTGKYRPGEPPPRDSRAASESMSDFISWLVEPRVLEAVRAPAAGRRAGRSDDASARARLGAARAERRLGDRRRQPARAGARQRVGRRDRAQRGHARGGGRGAGRPPGGLRSPSGSRGDGQALTAEMSSRILTLSETSRLPEPSAALNVIPKSLRSICPAAETPTRSLP